MAALTGLLGEKLALLSRILAETEAESRAIACADLDGLCASLEARQALMDAVDALDGRIAAATAGGGGAAQSLRAEMGGLLRRIAALDGENRRRAGELAGTFADDTRQIKAQKSLKAYLPEAGGESRFVNREG
jgi:hypothetical protein